MNRLSELLLAILIGLALNNTLHFTLDNISSNAIFNSSGLNQNSFPSIYLCLAQYLSANSFKSLINSVFILEVSSFMQGITSPLVIAPPNTSVFSINNVLRPYFEPIYAAATPEVPPPNTTKSYFIFNPLNNIIYFFIYFKN